MIEWVWPWAFLLLPAPWLARRLLAPAERRQAALMVPNVASFRVVDEEASSFARRIPWRAVLLWLIWLGLIAAAARPQYTGEAVTLPVTGRDLMLAIDISGSMGTQDLALHGRTVNRLAVVKDVVSHFVEARRGDRIGLILFGTSAYLQAPLTFDLHSVNRLLTEAPVGIAGGKTAIGDAIGLAVKRLRLRPAEERVLILLTDGANNVGEVAPTKAAELAAQERIRVHTIGVGATEMRMPSILGAFGSPVVNPSAELDEETMAAIAEATGGRYFRAQNTDQLREIYDIIDKLEPVEQDAETYRPVSALYHWPLALAWCLALGLIARDWRGDVRA